jgi:hypothetical protein
MLTVKNTDDGHGSGVYLDPASSFTKAVISLLHEEVE